MLPEPPEGVPWRDAPTALHTLAQRAVAARLGRSVADLTPEDIEQARWWWWWGSDWKGGSPKRRAGIQDRRDGDAEGGGTRSELGDGAAARVVELVHFV